MPPTAIHLPALLLMMPPLHPSCNAPPPDIHKSRLRALVETTSEGFARMLSDPWLFIWHTHLVLTFIHFITWQVGGGEAAIWCEPFWS